MKISVTKEQADCIIKDDTSSPFFASIIELTETDTFFLSDCFAKFYATGEIPKRHAYLLSEINFSLAPLFIDNSRAIVVKHFGETVDYLIGERYFYELKEISDDVAEKTAEIIEKIICTYFFLDESRGIVKIGKSTNPRERIKGINCGAKLEIIHEIPQDIEKKLHRKFKHINVHGEWFKFTDEIKLFINESKKTLK